MAAMADQQQTIDYVPVKAEDIIKERIGMYDAFTASIPYAVGAVAFLLLFLWVFWG
jgi:hypothetical protein